MRSNGPEGPTEEGETMDSDLAWVSDDIKVALESARQGLLDMEEDSRLVRCAVNAKSVADFWANMRNEEHS